MQSLPFITIVMPVRNEEIHIKSTLKSLLNQDYPRDRFEIIVADGMSTDQTRDIVTDFSKKYPNAILLDNPKRLSSAGRNVGFRQGRGDVFMVVDGHCYIPTDQILHNIAVSLDKSGAECLGRPQPLDPPGINQFQKSVALARASRFGHGGNSLIFSEAEGYVSPVSNGAIYRKEVFEKVGYVDESFDACEDVEFNFRVEEAGIKTYMSPSLTIKYYPRETLSALFQQMKRYGVGRFRLIEKHSGAFSINTLIPSAFMGGMILAPLLSLIAPIFFLAFGIIYGFYFLVSLCTSIGIAYKHGFRYLRHLIPIFLTIHAGLGWGFLTGLCKMIVNRFNKRCAAIAEAPTFHKKSETIIPSKAPSLVQHPDGESNFKPMDTYMSLEIQRIREVILNANPTKKTKTIMVTAAHEGAGATTLVLRLVISIALLQKMKILLVDMNMHHPRLHRAFGLDSESGFADVINNRINWRDACKETGIPQLKIMTSGRQQDEQTNLQGITGQEELLLQLQEEFDLVIVDTSAVDRRNRKNVDPVLLSRVMDMVVLVVREKVSTKAQLKKAIEDMANNGGKVSGIVFNKYPLSALT
jgi:capsular exopolysaccharide synthesis family protein